MEDTTKNIISMSIIHRGYSRIINKTYRQKKSLCIQGFAEMNSLIIMEINY